MMEFAEEETGKVEMTGIMVMVTFCGLTAFAQTISNGDMRWSAENQKWIAVGAAVIVVGQVVSIIQNWLLRVWQKEGKAQLETIEKKTDEVKEHAVSLDAKLDDNTEKTAGTQDKLDELKQQMASAFQDRLK